MNLPVVFEPYETVLFGKHLLNCTQTWLESPILLPMLFQMDTDTGGRLRLAGPKLKSVFPHASLLTGRLWREGGRDYKLISSRLRSPLL